MPIKMPWRNAKNSCSPERSSSGTDLVVLCEGRDDRKFLDLYFRECFPADLERIFLSEAGGVPKLKEQVRQIQPLGSFSDLKFFVIIRDSDEDPAASQQSIKKIFGDFGLPVPPGPCVWESAPRDERSPATGFLLFPTCSTQLLTGAGGHGNEVP